MLNSIKDPKFIISIILLGVGTACVFVFPKSNPHMILGTNIITGIAGYWIGTSISSSKKDDVLFKKGGKG